MTRPAPAPVGTDPGGPLVALCVGHRCAALRALAGTEETVTALADAVRTTRGAVLVTAGCLGACAVGAVAAVGHRDGGAGDSGSMVWLAGVHDAGRAEALTRWVAAGGPAPGRAPQEGPPAALAEAVMGVGPPVRLGG
ncbi:hypothetical protein [Geodermatophilus chilensis]|uniref:hypothetical protein n=1 Tax=Geodermatophilus chilensis TaxID=2035835 RepID=UPI000C26034E|nr:hypothetical protein [Geodermatophilus chilensis]